MHRSTDGRPAYSERRASLWQYWQSILYVCTCTLCGKLIGCTEDRAMAGWRLQEDTAKKTSTARSTTAAAPTPAFLIDSRVPSWVLANAREPYHLVPSGVNTTPRQAAAAKASAAAWAAASRSASECASETNAASNCDGARYTPRESIARKNAVSIEPTRFTVSDTPALRAPSRSPCSSRAPSDSRRAYARRSVSARIAASPAATASGLPDNVPA